MRYIKKVILENFQSHKYSELEFDNSLNVIVGPSDQGKSAIIRGIKWALFNEPSGDYFIREGENECSVTIIFNDKTKIKRYRSKSKNLYYLYDANGKETIFEGFGTKVPDKIIESINIKEIYLDGKQSASVNISDQLDGPFLLSEKTAIRANAIGRLVGVHYVDEAVSDTLKDIRNLNLIKKNTLEQLNVNREELKKYDYLDELGNTINRLEYMANSIKEGEIKVERLILLSSRLDKLINDITETQNVLKQLDKIDYIDDIIKKLNDKISAYIYISGKLKSLLDIKNSIDYNYDIINKSNDLENIQLNSDKLEKDVRNRAKLENLNSRLKFIKRSIDYNRKVFVELKNINLVSDNIIVIDNQYQKLATFKNIKKNITDIHNRIIFGIDYLDQLSDIDELENKIYRIEQKSEKLVKLTNLKNKRDNLLINLDMTGKSYYNNKKEINNLIMKYNELLSKFEVCPLCLNKIDQHTIEKIINVYK